jgi:hypothetical protein
MDVQPRLFARDYTFQVGAHGFQACPCIKSFGSVFERGRVANHRLVSLKLLSYSSFLSFYLHERRVVSLLSSFFSLLMSQETPPDVLALILQQLNLVDFCAAANTCNVWHVTARKKTAWPKSKVGALVFPDWPQRLPGARSLTETVWASCTHVSHYDRHGFESLNRQWLGRLSTELVHVSTLSFVVHTQISAPYLAELGGPLLGRLTSLRTNQVTLVQATSRDRLIHLTIAPHILIQDDREWMRLLPTLSNLMHVTVEVEYHGGVFGKALAQLADAHHTLRSITLPTSNELARHVMIGLLPNYWNSWGEPRLDLSSICILTNAPRQAGLLHQILARMPRLETFTCSLPINTTTTTSWLPFQSPEAKDLVDCDQQLESLTCSPGDLLSAPHPAHFANLFDLTLYDFNCVQYDQLVLKYKPFMRLAHLCLSSCGYQLEERDVGALAPHITHLSMNEFMMWAIHTSLLTGKWYTAVSSCFAGLSKLTQLHHLELVGNAWSDWRCPTDTTVITRAILTGMQQSLCWRHVTCARVPADMYVDSSHSFPPEQLALVRWHVVAYGKNAHAATTVVYRPRVRMSRWRLWVPGLRSHQVVWDRV